MFASVRLPLSTIELSRLQSVKSTTCVSIPSFRRGQRSLPICPFSRGNSPFLDFPTILLLPLSSLSVTTLHFTEFFYALPLVVARSSDGNAIRRLRYLVFYLWFAQVRTSTSIFRVLAQPYIHTFRSYVHTPRDFTNGASLARRMACALTEL